MPRIAGINIPENKQIRVALTYIYGMGPVLAVRALKLAGVNPLIRASALTPEELQRLRELIEKQYRVEGELRRDKMMNIKRLKDIGSWRGSRHIKGLPVRGQKTRINSRTVRGNVRKTVGSGKKAAPAPK